MFCSKGKEEVAGLKKHKENLIHLIFDTLIEI